MLFFILTQGNIYIYSPQFSWVIVWMDIQRGESVCVNERDRERMCVSANEKRESERVCVFVCVSRRKLKIFCFFALYQIDWPKQANR